MFVFNISEYGARADGRTLNTAAIQRAIDACHDAGGGRVYCGAGDFLTGSLQLKSRVDLHLSPGCRLVGSSNLADYIDFMAPGFRHEAAPEHSTKCLLYAIRADQVSITGPGEVNGSGPAFYDTTSRLGDRFYQKPATARPRMLMAFQCRQMRFEEAAFNDSPCWTFWLMQCQSVVIHRIRMFADQKMINNDGIDLDMCRDVTVSDSQFKTGDDCLVLRSIRTLYETEAPCENITVTNCVLDSGCQGIRVGCPGDGVIRNCTFNNLVITGAGNGIVFNNPVRYLPPGCRGSADIRNILFTNGVIDCRAMPISLDVEPGVALTHLGEIHFAHFRIRSGQPIRIQGSPETPIQNIQFSDLTVDTEGPEAIVCRQARGVKFNNVELTHRG